MRIRQSLGALGVVLAFAGAADAQTLQRGNAACRQDFAAFCAGVESGGGRRMRCLADNEAKLSAYCAAVVRSRLDSVTTGPRDGGTRLAQSAPATPTAPAPSAPAAAPPAASTPSTAAAPAAPDSGQGRGRPMAACRIDLATHCAGTGRGGGSRIQCLRQNQAKLAPDCAAALSALEQTRKDDRRAGRNACAADAQRLCGTEAGPARRQCLDAKRAELSPDCTAALTQGRASRASAAVPVAPKP